MVQETLYFKGLAALKEEENELVKPETGCKLPEYRISIGRASHSTRSLQLWVGEPEQDLNNAKLKSNINTTLVFWDKKKNLPCIASP